MRAKPHIGVAIIAYGSALILQKLHPIHFTDSFYIVNIFVSYFILCLITIAGALVPDFDLKFVKKERIYNLTRYNYDSAMIIHRQITHSILIWVTILFYAGYNGITILYFFSVGGISHLIADYFTGDIPIFFYGRRDKEIKSKYRIGINNWYNGEYWKDTINEFSDRYFLLYFLIGIWLYIISQYL